MANHQDPDNRAADQTNQADEGQLDRLYAAYKTPLERYFRKRVLNPTEVDDHVQEVFSRLAGRFGEEQLQNPEGYLFQIAANILRDRARRDIFRKAASEQFAQSHEDSFEAITPERVLLGKRRLEELKVALAEMPERVRHVFLLHRYEGMKYREIAEHLGISVSSVEKHMMAAIKHLARRLGNTA